MDKLFIVFKTLHIYTFKIHKRDMEKLSISLNRMMTFIIFNFF